MVDTRQSEEFAQQVLASMQEGLVVLDRDLRYRVWNRFMEEVTGLPASEVLGHDLDDVSPWVRQQGLVSLLDRALAGESCTMPATLRHLPVTGRDMWMTGRVEPLRNGRGEIIGVIISLHDITAQREAEPSLRQSEARFHTLFESNLIGVVIGNFRGGFTDGNDEFLRIVGYSREELAAGKVRWDQITPPEYAPRDAAGAAEVAQHGACIPYRKEYIRKDGTRIPVLVGYTRLEGAPDQSIAFILDLTPQQQIEESLRISEERLTQAIRVAQLGIFDHDHLTNAIFWSPLIREILGYAPDETVDFPAFLARIFPEDQASAVEAIRRAHDPAGDGLFSWECRITHPDGTVRWISTRSRTFFATIDGVRRPVRTMGATMDITARKQVEQQLQSAKNTAEEANRAKDHFLAVLSHELRTPLTPALAAANLLLADSGLPEHCRADVEVVRRNVELEARLIDDLLDVTRITRGKAELEKHPVQLRLAIEQAVEVCRGDMEARNLHFRCDLQDARDAIVEADPARLQQVFWNLLKNAVKFTPNGGQVDILGQAAQGWARIEVRDTGIGIESELLPRLFRPFEQGGAGTTRQFGGLGLGLTITKSLVEMHGGSITACSEGRDKGATFVVRLPLSTSAAAQPAKPPSPRPSAPPPAPAARILYVEDHGDTARIMHRVLTARGYSVQLAGDVATALIQAEAQSFDLLLSDLGLPDGSGLDLMRELRRRGHVLPGIALSGYAQEEDIQRTHESGFAVHLTKPIDPARLLATIAEICA